jgi:hypothetical protein
MRLKCHVLMRGPGPSETIVAISTADGSEEVVVDASLIHDDGLEVGRVLEKTKDRALVELPRESATGRWRVWVPRSALASA